tara:strand:- start:1638 stop:2180 length:543 start_codon:yes stop_codon:yes gene_type:complete
MKDLMLDIETMGTSTSAAIMSIGACYFDPLTGEIGDTFHEQVDISTNGMIDASTVIWWMKQGDDARSKFYDNGKAKSVGEVLYSFAKFIKKNTKVWGNGIAFDNVIIRNAFDHPSFSGEAPWAFWNDRDVRTIVDLGQVIGIDPKRDFPFEGVKHDALADAIHQAKYVSAIYQAIVGPYL